MPKRRNVKAIYTETKRKALAHYNTCPHAIYGVDGHVDMSMQGKTCLVCEDYTFCNSSNKVSNNNINQFNDIVYYKDRRFKESLKVRT